MPSSFRGTMAECGHFTPEYKEWVKAVFLGSKVKVMQPSRRHVGVYGEQDHIPKVPRYNPFSLDNCDRVNVL